MKQLLMAVILLIAATGCEQGDMVKNLDNEYLKQADKQISLLDDREQISEVLTKYNFRASPDTTLKGVWVLHLYVDEKGKVQQVRNMTPVDAPLPEKTAEAVEELITAPAEKNGKAVKSQSILTLQPLIASRDSEVSAWFARVTPTNEVVHKFISPPLTAENIGGEMYLGQAEEMPMPVGGIAALQKHIVYPEAAKQEGLEGRVFIKAYIDSTGNVVKAEVLRGIGGGCDEAALQAVLKTEFTPAQHHGEYVNAQIHIPIIFRLQ